jgi:hypothetical protein
MLNVYPVSLECNARSPGTPRFAKEIPYTKVFFVPLRVLCVLAVKDYAR